MLPTEDPAESHFEGHNNSGEATRPPRLSETAQTYGPSLHPPPHLPQGFQYVFMMYKLASSKDSTPQILDKRSLICVLVSVWATNLHVNIYPFELGQGCWKAILGRQLMCTL